MERLDKLIVCETDKGNFAVRPLNWAGCWDKDGKIKECGLNHIAVFHYREDAEWYAETKNAEEQGLILRLPFKIGQKVYYIYESYVGALMVGSMVYGYSCLDFPRAYFATKEEAEQALKQMGEKE